MTKRSISKASKRRIFTFGTISIIIITYFVINGIHFLIHINKLSAEKKQLSTELLSLKNKEDELKTEIIKLNDPDYIARYARENYLYSKDGEYVIRIDPKEDESVEVDKQFNYGKIALISTSCVLVTFILIKRKK